MTNNLKSCPFCGSAATLDANRNPWGWALRVEQQTTTTAKAT